MHLVGFHYKNLKNFSNDAVEIITALIINLFLKTRHTVTGEILSRHGINE